MLIDNAGGTIRSEYKGSLISVHCGLFDWLAGEVCRLLPSVRRRRAPPRRPARLRSRLPGLGAEGLGVAPC